MRKRAKGSKIQWLRWASSSARAPDWGDRAEENIGGRLYVSIGVGGALADAILTVQRGDGKTYGNVGYWDGGVSSEGCLAKGLRATELE